MHRLLSGALTLLLAVGAHAAENPAPQPLARSVQTPAKPELRRVAPPTMSVMRVTRQPDGTLATDCIQQPNPKAHAKSRGAQP